MSFLQNIFSKSKEISISNTSTNIPAFFKEVISGDAANCDTRTIEGQALAFAACSAVTTVVLKCASAVSNFKMWAVRDENDDTDILRPKEIVEFMQPNPYQNIRDFCQLAEINLKVFGICYIYQNRVIGIDGASDFYILPNIAVRPNYKIRPRETMWYEPNAVIRDYTLLLPNEEMQTLSPEDIIIIKDNTGNLSGDIRDTTTYSRLYRLYDVVNTFINGYGTINDLMINRGALSIISMGNGDMQNTILTKDEKDNVETRVNSEYGTRKGKKKYIVTNVPTAISQLSASIPDLQLTATQSECRKEIARTFEVPSALLEIEDSKYNNTEQAFTDLYNNVASIDARKIFMALNKARGYEGFMILPFFDHLPCFAEAKQRQQQGMTSLVNALHTAYLDGVLSPEEYRERILKYEI